MTTLECFITIHNSIHATGQALTDAEQVQYAAEMTKAREMFHRLTAERRQLDAHAKDNYENHTDAIATVAFKPIDMGTREVEGRQRQVLVQPVQSVHTEHGHREYPEATPGEVSRYKLEVFAVMQEPQINVDELEDALYIGTEQDSGVEVVPIGSETLLIFEPHTDQGFANLDQIELTQALQFNEFLDEVFAHASRT